jgi:hypothetical protein
MQLIKNMLDSAFGEVPELIGFLYALTVGIAEWLLTTLFPKNQEQRTL